MKLPCTIIEDILPLYADGICSEESRLSVEEHCAGCESCNKKLCAMKAELPEKKPGGKPENPIRKIVRHYLKLCFLTLLCSSLVGMLAFKALELTASENNPSSAGDSWSTIKYIQDFGKFGRLFKDGKYYEAMCMVDIRRVGNISTFTPEDQDEIYREYAKALEAFFEEYPMKGYWVDSYNYDMDGGLARVDVYIDLETPRKAPISLVYRFSKDRRDKDGRFSFTNADWSTEVVVNENVSEKNTSRDEFTDIRIDRHNVNVYFPKFNYADNWFAAQFKADLQRYAESGEFYSDVFESFVTKERLETASRTYVAGNDSSFVPLFQTAAPLTEEENDRIRRSLEKLFGNSYEFADFEYETPKFFKETIYKDCTFNESSCFKQNMKLIMKNGGNEFSVSFSAPVTNLGYIILPAENIVFSENAPEDFREAFLELFQS